MVLPYSAITETTWGDIIDEPTLEISYAVNGNLKDTLKIGNGNDYYETGDKLFLEDLNTTATGYEATVIVNRLQAYSYDSNGDVKQPADDDMSVAQQEYTLKVTMEKSSSTAIQSIMVNNTVVDEDALSADPISVELPTTWYNTGAGAAANQPEQTTLTSVKVAITTDATVSGVTLAGETQTGNQGVHNSTKTTRTWTFIGVNLSKEQTISVFAQDGTTMAQTGHCASYADSVSSAVLTAFSLKNGGNTYDGKISGNTITVEVPYMTTDLTGWTVFATPSAQAKAVAAKTVRPNPTANGSVYYTLNNPSDVSTAPPLWTLWVTLMRLLSALPMLWLSLAASRLFP